MTTRVYVVPRFSHTQTILQILTTYVLTLQAQSCSQIGNVSSRRSLRLTLVAYVASLMTLVQSFPLRASHSRFCFCPGLFLLSNHFFGLNVRM